MMIHVIMQLKDLKSKLTPEFLEDIKELDTEEKFAQGLENLNALFSGFQVIKIADPQAQ